MAITLLHVKLPPIPGNLRMVRVTDQAGLQRWVQGFAAGFGIAEQHAQRWLEVYTPVGFRPDAPWRHYVGMIDDEPVATSSLLEGAGVPGIYHVVTRAPWRGQGIGAALTSAPLQEAPERGHAIAVLQSSTMGQSVYQRMGFNAYCQLEMYAWTPAPR